MNNDESFKTNGRDLNPEWEARVVAWVLGEASPFEVAELERLCAEHPELAVFKRRIETVHGMTGEAVSPPKESLRLSPERRAKLLAVIGGNPAIVEPTVTIPAKALRQSSWWREWALPMAACLALMLSLAAVMVPTVGTVRFSAQKPKRPSPSETLLGPATGLEPPTERPDLPSAPPPLGDIPLIGRSFSDTAVEMEALAPAPEPVAAPALQAARNNRSQVGTGTGYATSTAGVRGRQATPSPSADPFAAPAKEKRSLGGMGFGVGVDKRVSDGRSQYLAGDMDAAQESFRAVEAQSPNDPQAKAFLHRIAMEKAAVAELKRVKQRREMIEEVTRSWNPPSSESRIETELIPVSPAVVAKMRGYADSGSPDPFGDKSTAAEAASLGAFLEQAGVRFPDSPGASLAYDGSALLVTNSERNIARIKELIRRYEAEVAEESLRRDARSETATSDEPVSTFSLHVGDASFRVAKAALERGDAPDPATIRPEEFYNAFDYGDPAPVAGEAVACRVEQAAHPFLQQRNLVRIAMRVPAIGRGASQPLRLTVLLDTSGSMEREDRAASVRAALVSLASLLGPDDRISLVGFARTPRLLAEAVPGDRAIRVVDIAENTPAEGGTNLEEALQLAGDIAARQWLAGAQNRIVLLTDGAANLGNADPRALAKRIEALRQNGIAFDACGIVADGLDDTVLEALTRKGDGRYTIIASPEEADATFARQLAGAFRPAAKDVKVQVRFNPARVARYRLIGFEQHRLTTEDFRDDTVDAAELASEEAAVALYQVEVLPEGEGELGEVFVRFLDTGSNQRVERSWTLAYAAQPAAFDRATPSLQLAGSAAFLAEELRGGDLAGQIRLDEFAPVVEGLAGAYPQSARVREFIDMFRQTRRLVGE